MPLRLVPPLPAGTPGDPGLTGPGSVTWRVCRERVVPLGGLSALLLQLAHPLVAAGVAEHSSVRADPTRRLMLTLEMLLVTTFGDARQVGEMTGRIAHIHRVVTGSLPQDTGPWRRGTPYSATSPELCLWVYATIIETTLNSYSAFVRPLQDSERAQLYRESESFGQLYGVGTDIRPASYTDFRDYYATTLARLTPGDQARSVARMILRARLRGIPLPPWGYLLAAGLLPAPLRAQYGLRWSAVQRALWWLFTHAVHVVMCRLAPARLRFWDHYQVAVTRCRPAERE
ncbi:MAG TPA: oxygenase MpaB family protein [Streptosporangiaceae bacterium]|nr:oxygenase MpaB family protein [Streptosporangiaceae bacterium]